MSVRDTYILAIESSCDDTSAAVIKNREILSNIVAGQDVHKKYGGVVPELASRAHQQNIVPVVDLALKEANIQKENLDAIAYTRGPGLMGSLLVGSSFAKTMAIALNIPLIEVNHLHAHVIVPFIQQNTALNEIKTPYLCLLVSGGHTQILKVHDPLSIEVLGSTIDDAAGEAFDKCAKILGLAYPGGPLIDQMAAKGNPNKFEFNKPSIEGLDYSFSGLKTSFLYFIQKMVLKDPEFIKNNMEDLCASIQQTIIEILLHKFLMAAEQTGVKNIAIAGGVSANKGLRNALSDIAHKEDYSLYIPDFEYTTDNAAMIAITGYYKYINEDYSSLSETPMARMPIE